ncbi:class I glutamine amidotransferase-like protein [Mariannaea sp. PMI_226]|nr:class I glutamine amidotransferase-like protein [Mariannaea sp. PMI_226]
MGSLSYNLRIAMLNADVPVPNVAAKAKTYGEVFHNLLADAALRVAPHIKLQSTDFDVKKGEYPASISDFDVILVTGSANSSYDDEPWIHKLDAYLKTIYLTQPHIKIFGSCFGHQIVCQSLLGEFGCQVEKAPTGWEIGVHEIRLTDEFRQNFPFSDKSGQKLTSTPATMRLQFVHADHVKTPATGLPESWFQLGATKACANQGVFQPGRVLTFQGHFEFDRFINSETLKVFGATWEPSYLQEVLEKIDADDDALAAAEMVLQFLL